MENTHHPISIFYKTTKREPRRRPKQSICITPYNTGYTRVSTLPDGNIPVPWKQKTPRLGASTALNRYFIPFARCKRKHLLTFVL